VASRHALVVGAELRDVSGASDEDQFGVTGAVTHVRSEGQQRNGALFVEDVINASSRLSLTAGIRFDSWRNFDASRNSVALANRSEQSWSPRLSALFRATDHLALTASAYRAFRAPTLNELYRAFRVGNALTNANESLGPETLNAFELGARIGNLRANAFVMNVEDTIANVTLSTTPALITRQRQNLGSTQTRGIEIESYWRVSTNLRASAGYLLTDARVTTGSLDGKRLPEVPRQQATLQTTWSAESGEG
jgi:outer membrane receptor protein involved in Fe transport